MSNRTSVKFDHAGSKAVLVRTRSATRDSSLSYTLALILIVIIAGMLSGILLTILTIIIIYLVFKRGYDPDNITGPALATFGDIITMFCIFGSALLIEVLL